MRPTLLLLSAFVVACNSTPVSTTTDSDGATGSSSGGGTTQGSSPVTDGSATMASTDTPTGSGGMSASEATTNATDTATSTTSTSSTSTTSPVDTDTGTTDPGTSTTGVDTTDGTGTSTGTGTGTTTGTSTTGDTTTGGMVDMCPCPDLEVAIDDGIFVLSDSARLYKFFPMNNTLELLGQIGCDLPPSTFSMAVDRLGFAWVQYTDGQLRKVDLTNVAKCSNPGYQAGQLGVTNFGMAFVSNSAFDACDQMFGDQYTGIGEGADNATFFRVDPLNQQAILLGKSDFGTAEVTGTGDGRVFLFAAKNPDTQLVEVDRNNGNTLSSIPLPGVKLGGGWAFAFFGGDFYFFTDGASDGKSEVTHIDYDDSDMNGKQDIKVVINNAVVQGANVKVVGAGVSTCAPTAPQ